jgi:hypothetical protein
VLVSLIGQPLLVELKASWIKRSGVTTCVVAMLSAMVGIAGD